MTPGLPIGSSDGYELIVTASEGTRGEARVRAPDGSMAFLIWVTGPGRTFQALLEPRSGRSGTYAATLPLPLTTDEEATRYLRAVLPELRHRWAGRGSTPASA